MGRSADLKTVAKIISLFVLLAIVWIDASHNEYSASSVVYIVVGLVAGADVRDMLTQYLKDDGKEKKDVPSRSKDL